MKNKITKPLLILGCIIIVFAFNSILSAILYNFRSTFSGVRTGYICHEDRSSFSASYNSLNGTLHKKISPKESILHIAVETKSGSLTIEVKDAKDNVIFDTACAGNEAYDINISGKITVIINADHHSGSLEISSKP